MYSWERGADLAAKDTYRVAVYDLDLMNIPEGMEKIVTASLLNEVRKLEGCSAVEELYPNRPGTKRGVAKKVLLV